MTPREVARELRNVQEKHKDDVTPTFGTCISDMARDAANAIEGLLAFVDMIYGLNNCNVCTNVNCPFRPKLGETIRYNCPIYTNTPREKLQEAETQYDRFRQMLYPEQRDMLDIIKPWSDFVKSEVNKKFGTQQEVGNDMVSVPNSVEHLIDQLKYLWGLLDDIDTVSDMAKENDKAYRKLVEDIHPRRQLVAESDGFKIFIKAWSPEISMYNHSVSAEVLKITENKILGGEDKND